MGVSFEQVGVHLDSGKMARCRKLKPFSIAVNFCCSSGESCCGVLFRLKSKDADRETKFVPKDCQPAIASDGVQL